MRFISSLLLLALLTLTASASVDPSKAGYVDVTAAPYLADNTGAKDVTEILQRACDDAVAAVRPVYLPAGVYRISDEIKVDKNPNRTREQNGLTISGPSSGQRAVIRLARGSFTDAAQPKPMLGVYYTKIGGGDRLCMVLQHVDFEIEADNAGAAGPAWGGAEASMVSDVHVRGVDGYRGFKYGFWTAPGSGGAMARTSVVGGQIGYYLDGFGGVNNGSRETASMTEIS